MHGAPSVSYPVGRSLWAAAIVLVLWSLGVAVTIAWALAGASTSRVLLAGSLAVLLGGSAGWAWWRSPRGTLGWDGAQWTWTAADSLPGQCGTVSVVLDLQRCVLLHWCCTSRNQWFWLGSSGAPERWDALRRAVYSRADDDARAGAKPPPSSTP